MATQTRSRKLEVFSLHCRDGNLRLDYINVFRKISEAPPSRRQTEDGDRLLALPRIRLQPSAGIVEFVAYEGPVGVYPLIFDAATGMERVERLTGKQVLATRTYGAIDLQFREAIIEYNHRGAKAYDVARLLEETGRRAGMGPQFSVELIPVVDNSFMAALDKFDRIRVAKMTVARPNFDWTDNYEGLNQVGAQSNGRTVELTVTAHRNGSLEKRHGIVQYIRQMIRTHQDNLKGAAIAGIREGEAALTRISLKNYLVHQQVNAAIDSSGHPIGEDLEEKLRAFLAARREER